MYSSLVGPGPAVERVWMGDSFVDPDIGHRSDPVLGLDLVFTFHRGSYEIAIQGPVTRRTTYRFRPGAEYLGVRFRPGAAARAFRQDLGELRDQAGPVERFGRLDLDRLADRLLALPDLAARGACLRRYVAADPVSRAAPPALVEAALGLFGPGRPLGSAGSAGPLRVGDVAMALGVTERRLQRVFRSHVGIGPKQAARLVRIQELLGAVSAPEAEDLAALALSMGYFDQAHMTNDVRRVLGTTPSALVDEAKAHR